MNNINTLISFIAKALKAGRYITDLQKSILDTWNEYHKQPFDNESALIKIFENIKNYQEIYAASLTKMLQYLSERRPVSEVELKELLHIQCDILASKELGENYHG